MPNSKTPREYNGGDRRRTAQRDKIVSLLAAGIMVKDISSQLSCSKKTIYGLLKEPEFMAKLDQERNLIAIDATSQTAAIINDAIAIVAKTINEGDGKLAFDLLKETGVLRTTGGQLGMEQKISDIGQSISVTINVSSDQFKNNTNNDNNNNHKLKDVECVVSDHNDTNDRDSNYQIES